ncbi:hypothetical protein A1O3_05557 [Capronia epimyces CBS 606.96]|uniref:Inositolphosphotransferase Aur1/Ipt1 domain-containing protein n=1 Tax=Capronia epimyces CBS 606.96 TaxID=1182542 RepID=W9XWG7_9EURO|nr:uncharacterized protein A1O3_05557 [Capronia epimyces CBS 606.96]EXJ84882.1 hypothetical protein A1O3_05557 [Capronia epimyces CBS 606.96]
MGFLGLGEPSLGTLIIFLGAWINRDFTTPTPRSSQLPYEPLMEDVGSEMALDSPTAEDGSLALPSSSARRRLWRHRELSLLGFKKTIQTPNTAVFQTRILSRVLVRFPFIMEIIYWALIYGVYQFGRGQLAIRFVDQSIDSACRHALAVIRLEQRLHIFWELSIQQFFLRHPPWMWWINRIYSFVHLPATITFLVGLYYFAITRNRSNPDRQDRAAGPELYESRRRALALCNLFAFCVFSSWPCMPPRLLGDSESPGELGELARTFHFVDTIHTRDGAVSVFNTRKWTNQLAAMPSLHFGYSLLVGVSIMRLPLAHAARTYRVSMPPPFRRSNAYWNVRVPSLPKLICTVVGLLYPTLILVAIVATANHFILDAVVGALICWLALRWNGVLKNLLPIEDYLFWCLRIHKPVPDPSVQGVHSDYKT